MGERILIRKPAAADALALSHLMGELGYPSQPEEIIARLTALDRFPDALTLVAELEGRVVGAMTTHVIPAIHVSPRVAMLTVLVVADELRGRGIGRELVDRAEAFAREHGATKISLTSALHRTAAHGFYKLLGYEHTGVRLVKELHS